MSHYSNSSSPKQINRYKFSCPVTIHNSQEVSFEQLARKSSVASLHNHIDIDKLMIDIKLKPVKHNNCQTQEKIKIIYSCLEFLKQKFNVKDQVRTAQLIIQSIQNKISEQLNKQIQKKRQIQVQNQNKRNKQLLNQNSINKSLCKSPLSSHKKQLSSLSTNKKDISPIKQLQQMTSRILYTNFSLKQFQSTSKPLKDINLSPNVSLMTSIRKQKTSQAKNINQVAIFSISKFDPEEQQIQKLNRQINDLQKLLQKKTSTQSTTNQKSSDFKKGKINKAMQQSSRKVYNSKQNHY